jgi:RNA polymerase sigma-70 factor, ECF subfamily
VVDCSTAAPDAQRAAPDTPEGAPFVDPAWPAGLPFERALERGRTRDPEALSLLYRRFLPVVYRFLLSRVRDVPLAEDLTSETFFAVMGGIADVRADDELGFAAWVLGIARHKLSQHFRRLKGHREVPIALTQGDEPVATAEEGDPLAVVSARESWAEVVAALDLLTPEQRTVLLHRCILGRSTAEVARLMGKPANAIYGLQFRALAALARHLRGSAWPTDDLAHDAEHPRERRSSHGA